MLSLKILLNMAYTEVVGRLLVIAPLDINRKDLTKILSEPKNSVIKQYTKLFSLDNVEPEFDDEALKEIAKKAISKKDWC